MGELLFLPPLTELTEIQYDHWMQQLEYAERAVEVAKRMLGLLPAELGLQGGEETPA